MYNFTQNKKVTKLNFSSLLYLPIVLPLRLHFNYYSFDITDSS